MGGNGANADFFARTEISSDLGLISKLGAVSRFADEWCQSGSRSASSGFEPEYSQFVGVEGAASGLGDAARRRWCGKTIPVRRIGTGS